MTTEMIIIAKTEMKITVVTEITKGLIGIEEAGVGTGVITTEQLTMMIGVERFGTERV